MTQAAAPLAAPQARNDVAFLGHPRGLGYLAFAEAWERFSFYGMQSLLVLYMTRHLLAPGVGEHVLGLDALHRGLERVYGPLSSPAFASVVYGFYAGGVFLTPLAGGLLADRVLGRTRTVTLGAVLMAVGHFLMAFDAPFLIALACILAGSGAFKGNITSQVGELYAADDRRRADAFQIFGLCVTVAVALAPLVCGTLGEKVAWHWGFAAAGIGMLAALAGYLWGRRWLPAEPARTVRGVAPGLDRGEVATVLILLAMIPVLAVVDVGIAQTYNAYLVWGARAYNLTLGGAQMPVTWLISLDSVTSALAVVTSVGFWRAWATRRREPQEATKLVIGAGLLAVAPLVLALGAAVQAQTGARLSLGWALAFHAISSLGYAQVIPIGLALFSRVSPRAVAGVMISAFYTQLFLTNLIVGWLGARLEATSAERFWLLHSALIGGAGLVLLGLVAVFRRRLAPHAYASPTRADAEGRS